MSYSAFTSGHAVTLGNNLILLLRQGQEINCNGAAMDPPLVQRAQVDQPISGQGSFRGSGWDARSNKGDVVRELGCVGDSWYRKREKVWYQSQMWRIARVSIYMIKCISRSVSGIYEKKCDELLKEMEVFETRRKGREKVMDLKRKEIAMSINQLQWLLLCLEAGLPSCIHQRGKEIKI